MTTGASSAEDALRGLNIPRERENNGLGSLFRGPNSIDNFASSYQRAQSFLPFPGSLNTTFDDEGYEPAIESSIIDDSASICEPDNASALFSSIGHGLQISPGSTFAHPRRSSLLEGYDNRQYTEEPLLPELSLTPTTSLVRETTNLLTTKSSQITRVIVGQSTGPQTIFNSINVMIGIALLSLPLAFNYAGWVIGVIIMLSVCSVMFYTALLIAKCLERDARLQTYVDIAQAAFGHSARYVVMIFFCLELWSSNVALIILFADSFHLLVPSVSEISFKVLAFLIITPLYMMPLSLLSFSSIMGILSTFSMLIITGIDGLTMKSTPGSLISPMPQHLWPISWKLVPLSFGLLLAPWGGHSVFPNIYRDMRHPYKFSKCLEVTYGITCFVDSSMAVLGILMFGQSVRDEVTQNLLSVGRYPAFLDFLLSCCLVVIPVTKSPLNARPIITIGEMMLGVDDHTLSIARISGKKQKAKNTFLRVFVNVSVSFVAFVVSILLPKFESIMSLMGSGLCVTTSIILPILFYHQICKGEASRKTTIAHTILIIISFIIAVVGTVWVFLPEHFIKS